MLCLVLPLDQTLKHPTLNPQCYSEQLIFLDIALEHITMLVTRKENNSRVSYFSEAATCWPDVRKLDDIRLMMQNLHYPE